MLFDYAESTTCRASRSAKQPEYSQTDSGDNASVMLWLWEITFDSVRTDLASTRAFHVSMSSLKVG